MFLLLFQLIKGDRREGEGAACTWKFKKIAQRKTVLCCPVLCCSVVSVTLNAEIFLKEPPAQVFSCEFCKILTNTFFYRTLSSNCFNTRRIELGLFLSKLHKSVVERVIKSFWRLSLNISANYVQRKLQNCNGQGCPAWS